MVPVLSYRQAQLFRPVLLARLVLLPPVLFRRVVCLFQLGLSYRVVLRLLLERLVLGALYSLWALFQRVELLFRPNQEHK
jgi:hypothetical protein